MKLAKIKLGAKKVTFVLQDDDSKTTHEYDASTYSRLNLLTINLKSIAERVYQLNVGELNEKTLVEANALDIKWNGDAVQKIKLSGTITTPIGTPEDPKNVSVSFKTKGYVEAGQETEFGNSEDILALVATLAQQFYPQSVAA